jgi:predicted ribosome quality control (RQC) complex YloA/Tae2 family protein
VVSLDRLPPEVLREAARLAAAHSEAKHSAVVPVDYTFRRYVRKPRGSGPGRVVYTGEKTIHVDPSGG